VRRDVAEHPLRHVERVARAADAHHRQDLPDEKYYYDLRKLQNRMSVRFNQGVYRNPRTRPAESAVVCMSPCCRGRDNRTSPTTLPARAHLQHEVGSDGEEGPREEAREHPRERRHLVQKEKVQQVRERQRRHPEERKQHRDGRQVGARVVRQAERGERGDDGHTVEDRVGQWWAESALSWTETLAASSQLRLGYMHSGWVLG
jgi:hypothetical protein